MTDDDADLVVAVTGPTGTFGHGLMPLLEADPRVARVVGIARRPFDPAARGWSKMAYRRGDVRDAAALEQAFAGADVVVHLAFSVMAAGGAGEARAVNVDGTLNALRAAAAAGARRFVYASSVAAYGFHRDNPVGITEEWPTRPARRLRYGQDKAEIELLLAGEAAAHPEVDLYVLRPPVVVGPHTIGAKQVVSGPLAPLARRLGRLAVRAARSPVPVPVPVPALPLQLVHEDDVGRALVQCIVGAGPPGAYNIAGDGVLTGTDLARELGLWPLRVPAGLARSTARALAALPDLPFVPSPGWAEALTHPAIMNTTRATRDLGWRPRYTGVEALRATLDPAGDGGG
ncbi:MAG TPA: NAD-dependent epimerase/dehydratase family protein [Acidimicrobiales bacterium]